MSLIARNLDRRDRLSDGKARLEISLRGSRGRIWRRQRFAHNGGRSAVRRRRGRESDCFCPAGEEVARAALARPYRFGRERSGDVHGRRPPVCAGDGRGSGVGVLPPVGGGAFALRSTTPYPSGVVGLDWRPSIRATTLSPTPRTAPAENRLTLCSDSPQRA